MELFHASNQWSTRPDDERFSSLEEMRDACWDYAQNAAEATAPFNTLRVEADGSEIKLIGKQNAPARFTHFSFEQFCRRINLRNPQGETVANVAQTMRALPPTLAASVLNYGLAARKQENTYDANLLFHQNGGLMVRSLMTEAYQRIWNWELCERLIQLREDGWRVPPARPARADQKGIRKATEADLLDARDFGLSIKLGDLIAPAGLYASDHDMFAFMVNERFRINDGTEGGLSRGVFYENSEVGDRAIRRTTFRYRHVCGNHIVWGAQDVKVLKIAHTGNVKNKLAEVEADLIEYLNGAASIEEAQIASAKSKTLGATKDEVIDALFNLRAPFLTKKVLTRAYDACEEHEDKLNPRSVYGMVQGITRISQETPYADERANLDRAAFKVLKIAF